MGDLVSRLRAEVPYQGKSRPAFLCHEAADTIQSLTAKLERAKEGLFKIDRAANGNRKDKAARISELARQALKDIEND